MSNTKELLQLQLAQAEQVLYKAKNNSYSDQFKEEYQKNLEQLFNKVKQDVEAALGTSGLTDSQIYDGYKKHLDFIFKSLEFLDSSTLNQIPYEIVECLNHAMQEWLEPSDKFIIVTSLINDISGFSYDPFIAFNENLHIDIKTRYNIEFPHRLVQINLPKAFSRDYISAVVLYHELGHFIDMKFNIVKGIVNKLLDNFSKGEVENADIIELKKLFPYLEKIINPFRVPTIIPTNLTQPLYSHFTEYFCDLFASQYIGEASNYYLTYITENNRNYGNFHPSTENRVKVVSEFLNGTTNPIIILVNEGLTKIKSTTLTKRFENVSLDDFYNLIPTEIENTKQLHGLFNAAWVIWLLKKEKLFEVLHSNDNVLLYNIINNLVEKSIGNYITTKKWNQAQKLTTEHTPAAA